MFQDTEDVRAGPTQAVWNLSPKHTLKLIYFI